MNEQAIHNLYENLRSRDPKFTMDEQQFGLAMQDENNRRNLHANIQRQDSAFTMNFDAFNEAMGYGAQPATPKAQPVTPKEQVEKGPSFGERISQELKDEQAQQSRRAEELRKRGYYEANSSMRRRQIEKETDAYLAMAAPKTEEQMQGMYEKYMQQTHPQAAAREARAEFVRAQQGAQAALKGYQDEFSGSEAAAAIRGKYQQEYENAFMSKYGKQIEAETQAVHERNMEEFSHTQPALQIIAAFQQGKMTEEQANAAYNQAFQQAYGNKYMQESQPIIKRMQDEFAKTQDAQGINSRLSDEYNQAFNTQYGEAYNQAHQTAYSQLSPAAREAGRRLTEGDRQMPIMNGRDFLNRLGVNPQEQPTQQAPMAQVQPFAERFSQELKDEQAQQARRAEEYRKRGYYEANSAARRFQIQKEVDAMFAEEAAAAQKERQSAQGPQPVTSSTLTKIRNDYAQEVYDRRYQNKDGKPKDSFGKDLFENWQAGVGQIALMPYRAVETLENFGMDIENAVRGTNFQHGQGTATRFMNSVMGGDYLRSRVRHYQKESDRYQDNKGIIESGLEGDLGTAAGKAILGTVQSAPNLLVSIYSGKKGLEVFGGALLGTTAALQKYDEIHDRADLSTADKALDMFGAFVAECVPEIIGAKRFGKMFNRQTVGAVRREVQQEVMTGWGKFLNSRFVQGSGKTFDWLMKYFGEGLTEGMTDLMNLAIDRALGVKDEITKSDLLGIGDSFIIGQLSDAGPSAVHAYQRHDYNSRVRQEIENNPDLSLVSERQQVDAQAIADIATKAAFGDALTEKERKVFDAYKDEIGKQTAIRYGINNVCAAAGVSEDPNKHAIFISAIAQSGKTQEEVKKLLSKEYEDRTEADQRYLDEELPALMREQQRISTAIDNGEPVVAYNSPLFGNVYQWMRGKNAEAVAFLEKQGNGYLKGVFHRDGLGDVDILWGSDRAGLNNIIDNHVRTNDDFDSAEEAMDIIDQVITYGSIREENGHIVAELAPFRVSLTESRDGTLVVTAFENKHNEETPQVETPAAPESEQPTVEQPTAQPETQADELRQRAAAEAQKEINEIAHQDGNVYRVTVKGSKDKEGYVMSGNLNVRQSDNGSFITNGRELVTIKMTDGSVAQVPADEVILLEAPSSAQDRLQAITDHLYARYANNEVFHIGDKVTIKQNGQTSGDTSTITNITDDGVEVEIIDPNGQPNTTVIPHEEAAEKLAVVPGETEQGIISINIPEMGELRLRDLGNGQYQTLAPDGAGNYQTFTEDQIAEYMEQPAQEAAETPEPTPQAAEATPQAAPQVSMPQASMPTVQTPQEQQPTDAAALRANMTAEDYGRTVVEQLEGDKEMAGRMVAAQLKQAQAALAELQKQSVTEPEDPNDLNAWKQYKAQKNALQHQIEVVQADVEKLTAAQQAVADYKSPAELQAEQEAAAQAEREAAIEARKQLNEQMRQRAAEFADKLGVTIVPFESTDELPESQQKVKDAMPALDKNKAVAAWYDPNTRSVYLNLQKITDMDDLVAKIFHEAVAHLGLKEMMNRIDKGVGFNKLLRGTWNSMSEEAKERYAAYVYASRPSMRQGMSSIRYENLTSDEKTAIRNRDDVQLAAADEYIANLAEKRAKLEASDKSENANAIRKAWSELVQFFRELYVSLTGANLTVTDEDLAKLIHLSYTELKRRAAEQRTPEEALSIAEAETDTNPTEAQKKAENYKQGHVTLWGLPITIENPKGSIRRGTDANGKQWEQEMHHTYGKIRRTEGVDGDHIDVFIGPNLTSDKVFVVDQRNVDTGEFDEHKCMLGFDSLEDAQNGYLSNYEEGWQGMGTVTEVTMDEFKKWIDSSHRKTKPFAEYKSVKTEGAASTAMEEQQQTTQEAEEPQPIGQGLFGYIYDQFRGKVKEAFDFLLKHKSGDLLGVFHDDTLGDIDLVWGSKEENKGLDHIIDKHVGEGKDFATIDDAMRVIEDVIKNGKKIKNRWDKVTFDWNGLRVVVSKNVRDKKGKVVEENKNWVVTSFDNNVPKSKKKSSASARVTPESVDEGRAVTSDDLLSGDKGTTNNSDTQENEQENAKNLQNLSVLQDLVEKNDQNNTPQDYLRTLPDEQLDALEDILDPMRYEESDQGKLADEMHTFVVKEQARRYDMELEERRIAARKPAESEQLKRFYELHDGLRRSLMSKDGKYNEWIHEISDYLHSLAASKLRDIYKEAVRLNGVENVPGNLRDAYEHVHSVLEEMQNFDEVLAQQGDLSGTPSKPKINIRDWVADKTQVHEVLQGVYNDPSGVGVASNGHILIATPSLYDQSKSGTVVKPNGTVVDADYAKWQPVVDSARRGNQNTASVDWEAIRSFIAGIKDKMKADGHPWNKKYLDKIVFRMPDGKVIGFRLTNFIPFADAAALIGSPVLHYSGMNGMFHVENGNSVALIMPIINMTENGVDNYFYDLSNGQPMFSLVDEDENNKTLVGLHNISAEKLRKAIKMGGLANPSTAVIDIARQNHEQYGDISLIMPSSLVDSKTGRNAGTFTGDIWSPTYPSVERIMSDKGDEAYYQAITKAFGDNEARRPILSRAKLDFDDYLDSGNIRAGLAYWYLLEKGIEPGDVYFNSGISDDIKERFRPLYDKGILDLTKDDYRTLLSLIAEQQGKTAEDMLQDAQESKARYQQTIDDPEAKQFYKKIAQQAIDEIDLYGVRYNVLSNGYHAMERAVRDDGKIDLTSTLIAAQDIVQTQHQADFDKWLSDMDKRFDIKEVLFEDYDRDGNRIYKPHTLANASRMMNKEDLQNAGDHSGLGATRGQLVERMETLADIRAEKGRLRPGAEEDFETEEWNKMQDEWFNKVLNPLSEMQKISDNPFSQVGYAETRLQEALRTKDPIATLNKEYGYKIDPNGEWAKNLRDMVQRVKDLPTKYFETKFRRPVYLDEFANAVVPVGLPQDLREGLTGAGMTLFEYDPNVEGSRRVATLQATEDDGVRFALVDEEENAAPERDYNSESLIDYAKRMQTWHKEQKAVNERVSQAEASTEGDLFTEAEPATQNDDHVLYSLVNEEGVEEVPTPTEVIEAFMSMNSARNDMRSVKFRNQRIGNMRALREQLERLRSAWEREITNAETTGNEQGRIVGEIEQGIRDRQLALKEEYQKSARMITDFAKAMFRGKVIQNMTDADFSRLMTEIRDASTKFDLQRSYDALTEVLNRVQSRYLQLSQETLNKAATIPTTRRNATGVDEGRRVDPIHHQMLTTFNELRNTDVPYVERKLTEWKDAITSETSDTELGLLSAKIAAANIAKNYLEQRKQIEEASTELGLEIKTLGQEIHDMWEDGSRGAERKEKLALRMTKMHEMFELRDKYIVLNDETALQLGELTAEGHTQYIEDIKAKAEHKREVLRGMSRDLRGIPDNAAASDEDKGGLGDKYLSPLRTFTHELRKFGTHSAGGEGYLYHHFAPLVHDARSNYLEHVRERMNMLDSKAQELFGEGVTWKDVINKVSNKVTEVEATWNMPEGADTEVDSAGIPKKKKAEPRFLTQGQIMYIYMVNKMSDGKLKLRDMNISEAQVEYLRQQLPTELVQLADWLQDEYFPTTRKRYNETNIFLYGTPMAEIPHYVPLRISGDSRTPNVDIQQGDKQLLPSNVTGSAISRTFNKLPIDLKTDAMQLVLDNMEEMEHWSAYAELITDLNTLLNSTSFKNRIEKMNPNNYANFFKTAQLAVEQYRPKQGIADALVTGLTRFIATSKISLRLWTALKQTLSFISPLSEGGEFNKEYMHAIAHSKESFQWALENLPIFRERLEGRQGGNEKLNIAEITTNGGTMNDLLDWAQKNLVKYGIMPNAFVDAVVCANMAKAQYEVKKRYYEERGYSPEAVERLAKWKADEIYNETQQSSEGAFISPMQRDRTFISSVISLFNNSSMAYNRKNAEALREAYKIAKRDKQEFVDFRTEQLIKDGVAPEQAAVFAEQDYNRARKHAIADIAINGFVIQYVWNRGGKLFKTLMMLAPMFFFGDDDDREKAWDEFTSELKKDMVVSGVQPIRGLPFGATLESAASEAYDWFVDDTKRKYMNRYEVAGKIASNIHPAIQDASTIISSLTKKEVDALGLASLIVNMSASSLTSIDTQTLASMLWAAEDFIEKTGRWTWNDIREDMAIFLNVPPSQIEKMVLAPRRDETPYEYSQRYTTYQKLRRYGVFVPFADTPDLTKTQKKKLNEEWNK